VIDFAPRVPSHQDVTVLTNLAAVVMDELELRLSARNAIADYQQELVRREQREEHIRALLRELAHRSKNLLSVVQAIAMQTVPNSQTIHDYVTRLAGRVQALGHTHDLIADEDWQGRYIARPGSPPACAFCGHRDNAGSLRRPSAGVETSGGTEHRARLA
jgi:hypothetical protein